MNIKKEYVCQYITIDQTIDKISYCNTKIKDTDVGGGALVSRFCAIHVFNAATCFCGLASVNKTNFCVKHGIEARSYLINRKNDRCLINTIGSKAVIDTERNIQDSGLTFDCLELIGGYLGDTVQHLQFNKLFGLSNKPKKCIKRSISISDWSTKCLKLSGENKIKNTDAINYAIVYDLLLNDLHLLHTTTLQDIFNNFHIPELLIFKIIRKYRFATDDVVCIFFNLFLLFELYLLIIFFYL